MSRDRAWTITRWASALLLVAFPVRALVAAVGSRFPSVAGHAEDYVWGARLFGWSAAACLLVLPRAWRELGSVPVPVAPGAPGRPSRGEILFLVLLGAASIALRMVHADASLQHDEWFTLTQYVRHGPLVFLTRAPEPNNHPLATLAMWLSSQAFGSSEIALRLPFLVLGGLSPLAFHGLCRRLWTPVRAGAFAILFSLSTAHVHYSQEARGYVLVLFFAPVAIAAFLDAVAGGGRRAWIVYVAASVAAIYSQWFACLLPVGLWIASLVHPPTADPRAARQRSTWALAAIALLSLLLYAPILTQLAGFFLGGRMEASEPPANLLGLAGATLAPLSAQIVLVLLAAVGLGAVHEVRPLLPTALLAALVPAVGIGLASPTGIVVRFLLFAHPLIVLCVCAGAVALAEALTRPAQARIARPALLALLACVYAVSLGQYFQGSKVDFQGATAQLEKEMKPTDRVGLWFDCKTMLYYARRREGYRVVGAAEVMAEDWDWLCIQDVHVTEHPTVKEVLESRYEVRQRRETIGERTLLVWRRR